MTADDAIDLGGWAVVPKLGALQPFLDDLLMGCVLHVNAPGGQQIMIKMNVAYDPALSLEHARQEVVQQGLAVLAQAVAALGQVPPPELERSDREAVLERPVVALPDWAQPEG